MTLTSLKFLHMCKLLYNCLLYDFETADTIIDVGYLLEVELLVVKN